MTHAADLQRCDAEIADARAELRAGNPDVAGLCLAIADWAGEKRMIEHEREVLNITQEDVQRIT